MKILNKYFRFLGIYNIFILLSIFALIFVLTKFTPTDNTLLIGIITSAIITLIAILIENLVKSFSLLLLLKLDGKYKCYSHSDDNKLTLNNSEANIKYIKDNQLTIKVTDRIGNCWSGNIIMFSNEIGKVAWRYDELDGKTNDAHNRHGLKDLTVIYDNRYHELTINLISYHDERFSGEVLKK